MLLRGEMEAGEYGPYVMTQMVAGLLAGLVVLALGFGADTTVEVAEWWKVAVVEFLFTFALAYVVLNVATAQGTEDNSFYGLAIGFTVVVGAYAVGSVSGGAFNPAVAVGASVAGMLEWTNIWIYLIANLSGGAAAAYVFLFTDIGEKTEGDVRASDPDGVRGTGAESGRAGGSDDVTASGLHPRRD